MTVVNMITLAYGARKSRAVMCNRNFVVFVNFPKQTPKLIRPSFPTHDAYFINVSLKRGAKQIHVYTTHTISIIYSLMYKDEHVQVLEEVLKDTT